MNSNERENLKRKIEADLELLAGESWSVFVTEELEKVLSQLKNIRLEGYDD